jgi:hypothetical protein
LLLDSGNFSDAPSPMGDIKTRALLEGMQRIGYHVVNIGERDVRMGYDSFVNRTKDSTLPFISANLVRQDTGERIWPGHAVVELATPDGGKQFKIGVIGVARLNAMFMKPGPDGSNMILASPVESVKREMAELKQKNVDIVVLLTALHKNDARKICDAVSGIDFVVGAYGGAYTIEPERFGDTWVAYSGNQGKRLGETRVFFDSDGEIFGSQTYMHFLTKVYPDNQEMLDFVGSVLSEKESAAVTPPAATNDGLLGGDYIGSLACKACHEKSHAGWRASGHASALASLREKGKVADEGCISCHATAVGEVGGYVSLARTPGLAGVGCESCHGPGKLHREYPQRQFGMDIVLATCTECHDAANSPKFDYYAYLEMIKHKDR